MEALRPEDPQGIGGYQLLARIGAGGMGEVFLGRSPGGRAVAIKVIHATLANDAGFRARFLREVAAARAVTGAFTAPLIDADPEAAQPWLATAFLPGLPLDEAIAGFGPWPPPVVYLLGASLAEALVSIHRAGVVHRDLKPSNILLTAEGPRVIDFGIARAADAATITQTGAAVGTPSYMAPEQATGSETGPPGDVFSLGAVLTYAATAATPFGGGGSIPQLIYRVVNEPPYLDAVPDADLRALIAGCLDKDPERRPSAAELLERLAAALTSYGGAAPQGIGWLPPPVAGTIAQRANLPLPAAPTVPLRRRRPSRRTVLVGGAVAGAALAVGGVAAWQWSRRPRSPILWSFDVPEFLGGIPELAGNTLYATGQETFALDARTGKLRWRGSKLQRESLPVAADGRVFLYDGSSLDGLEEATGRSLWSNPIDTHAPFPVPTAMSGLVCMTASPETGSYVLLALDAATGERRWQYEGESLIETNAAAAGGVFYVASGGELLYAIDANGRLRWQQSMGAKVETTPVIVGGLVYVIAQGREAFALEAATGKRRWRNATAASSGGDLRDPTPVVAGGLVYVWDPGRLRAIDANTGRNRWTFDIGDGATSPIVAGGLAIVHDRKDTLYAVDTRTGKARWTQRADMGPGDRPAVMNGAVYVGGGDGVYGFDLASGRLVFRMTDEDFPNELVPYIHGFTARDGVLYCSVGSKKVYAIQPS